MQGSISLTNQKQSVVSWREFAICCAHGLCSLAYCFSHCELDFPPTHPIVFPPCLRRRRLLAGFWFSGCLPVLAGCLPVYLRLYFAGPMGCLPPPLWLFARSRAIVPSPCGCLPGVRLLADVCICASAY
jgi:hypothetical protein